MAGLWGVARFWGYGGIWRSLEEPGAGGTRHTMLVILLVVVLPLLLLAALAARVPSGVAHDSLDLDARCLVPVAAHALQC